MTTITIPAITIELTFEQARDIAGLIGAYQPQMSKKDQMSFERLKAKFCFGMLQQLQLIDDEVDKLVNEESFPNLKLSS